jgi:hypothetical protein
MKEEIKMAEIPKGDIPFGLGYGIALITYIVDKRCKHDDIIIISNFGVRIA